MERQVIYTLVLSFFGDPKKAELWMTTPNPMLGGAIPDDMIAWGRGEKLLKFVETALAENEAP